MKSWVLALALVALPAAGHEGPTPNRVDVSPTLSTSGQPTRAFLETLKEQGYEAVVDLAPPTVQLVRRALLDWYRADHRDFPWRGTCDPYAVLVSEVSAAFDAA